MADDVTINSEELDKMLENVTNSLVDKGKEILDDLAELALDEMQKNYAKAEYQAGEEMNFIKKGTETEKIVAMTGPQAAYSEFGTGTRGGMHPHPKKNEYSLNPYNSGATIRAAKTLITTEDGSISPGTLYWTYKSPDGQIHYTQGIPAQKEVFDAGQTVIKQMPSIIKKRMEEIFRK